MREKALFNPVFFLADLIVRFNYPIFDNSVYQIPLYRHIVIFSKLS